MIVIVYMYLKYQVYRNCNPENSIMLQYSGTLHTDTYHFIFHDCKVSQSLCHPGVMGTHALLIDLQGPLVQRLCFSIFVLNKIKNKERVCKMFALRLQNNKYVTITLTLTLNLTNDLKHYQSLTLT